MSRETTNRGRVGRDPREANSAPLSPLGRGRPEGPGEGVTNSPATSDPPHPSPLPCGERENAAASSQPAAAPRAECADQSRSGEANSTHLSASGREPAPDLIRGRPSEARSGEGGSNSPAQSDPPHPIPLPCGERENAAVGSLSAAWLPEPVETALSEPALYRLLAWLSPAYPVGAFSYSGGLEWAVEAGDVNNADTLAAWLEVIIGQGAGFCDAVLFAHAHAAATALDDAALRSVAELAAAFAPSKERHLETIGQGGAFLEVTRAAWPCAALDRLKKIWPGPYAYPVAVATAAAGHRVALEPALAAYLQGVAANLVSAGMRLIPLGQTDGQRVIASMEPLIAATARRAMATALGEMGAAAFRADLASQRHETQYTRLFRS